MLYQHLNSIGNNFFECRRYENFCFNPHIHRHPELIYVREGAVELETRDFRETVHEGEFALILPHMLHSYFSPGRSVVDVCICSQDYAHSFFRELRDKRVKQSRFVCPPTLRQYLSDELFCPDRIPEFYLIKSLLYGALHAFHSQVPLYPAEAKSESLLDRIVKYVNNNYTENITLQKMSAELGYESHYLSRYFHSKISLNFSQYVNWYRVDLATDLLNHTDLPMTEIASRSGFQSISSFNRVYKEFTGDTPSRAGRQ